MPIELADMPPIAPGIATEQLVGRMGIEIISASLDAVVGRMPVAGNRQMFGLLHGGASGVPSETLGAILSALHDLPERYPVGLELACTHHRGATAG